VELPPLLIHFSGASLTARAHLFSCWQLQNTGIKTMLRAMPAEASSTHSSPHSMQVLGLPVQQEA
jgi:hypothetical protein